jgi:hypothetical protein
LAIDDVMKIVRILDIRRSHIVSCCYVLGEVYACPALGEPQQWQRGNRATSMRTAGKNLNAGGSIAVYRAGNARLTQAAMTGSRKRCCQYFSHRSR